MKILFQVQLTQWLNHRRLSGRKRNEKASVSEIATCDFDFETACALNFGTTAVRMFTNTNAAETIIKARLVQNFVATGHAATFDFVFSH